MSIPETVRPLLQDRKFWRRFFWELEDDREYPQLEDCVVSFPLGEGAALELGLDEGLTYHSLSLRHPSLPEPVEIGWDDQAHWHPHVLRWDELDLIGRCAALTDPELPHPGVVVALLHRFTPVCREDDAWIVQPLLEGAYRTLGFRGKALEERVHAYDFRDAGFHWRRDPERGWLIDQDLSAPDAKQVSLYSLRIAEETIFPHAIWDGLMARLQASYQQAVEPVWRAPEVVSLARTMAESGRLKELPALAAALEAAGCRHPAILAAVRGDAEPVAAWWVLELLLEEPRGALIGKRGGPKQRAVRVKHRFELEFPGFPVRPRERPDRGVLALVAELHQELKQGVDGRAEMSGLNSTYCERGRKLLEETFVIACHALNDADAAIRIMTSVLRKHAAPPGTKLRQVSREEREIPLGIEE